MNDLLDQIVTIKALLNDLEMSIMQHELNPLNTIGQCGDCLNWLKAKHLCLKYKATPPLDVISGQLKCEGYEPDIPF